MRIGVPKEILNNENRVAMTPAGAYTLKSAGHEVYIETGAGLGSSFTDNDYIEAGATIVLTAKEAWDAELIMKVKEPKKLNMTISVKDKLYLRTFTLHKKLN